jgi:hypothetical protein
LCAFAERTLHNELETALVTGFAFRYNDWKQIHSRFVAPSPWLAILNSTAAFAGKLGNKSLLRSKLRRCLYIIECRNSRKLASIDITVIPPVAFEMTTNVTRAF